MVDGTARSRLGRSLSKLKSRISNHIRKSISPEDSPNNYLNKDLNARDSRLYPPFQEDSFQLVDSQSCDNNVDDPGKNSQSVSPPYGNNFESTYFGDNVVVKKLEKNEVERICREYTEANGPEFLNVGLKTYVDAVVDTKNFRNRCFRVLSRKPNFNKYYVSTEPPSLYSDYASLYNNSHVPNLEEDSRPPDLEKYRRRRRNAVDLTNYRMDLELLTPEVKNNSYQNDFKQTPHKLTQRRTTRSSHRKGELSRREEPRVEKLHKDQKMDDLSDFINKYQYLNSNNELEVVAKDQLFGEQLLQGQLVGEDDALKQEVLSHNEKLQLLKKIGIDDYIASRICSKFRNGNKGGERNLKSLKDFNMFYKNNLKHQLDLNYQLSREIYSLSNCNSAEDRGESDAEDLHFLNTPDNTRSRNSLLFERISSTIDKNQSSDPINILNLTLPS